MFTTRNSRRPFSTSACDENINDNINDNIENNQGKKDKGGVVQEEEYYAAWLQHVSLSNDLLNFFLFYSLLMKSVFKNDVHCRYQ